MKIQISPKQEVVRIHTAITADRVRRMFGIGLDAWNNVLIGSLAIGAVAAIIVGISTYIVVQLTKAESEALKLEIAGANERAAEANGSAALANERAEKLRADSLALQKLMQPRRLGALMVVSGINDPDLPVPADVQFSHIKKFTDVPVLIQSVPEYEAQQLALDMKMVISAFGWRPQLINESVSHFNPMNISDGVRVTYTRDDKYAEAAQALAQGFTKAGLTGPSGWNRPPVVAQGMTVTPDGKPFKSPFDPWFDPSIEGVIVLIGTKPIPIQ